MACVCQLLSSIAQLVRPLTVQRDFLGDSEVHGRLSWEPQTGHERLRTKLIHPFRLFEWLA